MELGLQIRLQQQKVLFLKSPNKESLTWSEVSGAEQEIEKIFEYIRPLVEPKLTKAGITWPYIVFMTDYVLTSNEKNAYLQAKDGFGTRPEIGFYTLKDTSGAFTIKAIGATTSAFQSGLRFSDRITAIGTVPTSYMGGGLFKMLSEDSAQARANITVQRAGQLYHKRLAVEIKEAKWKRDSISSLDNTTLYIRPGPFKNKVATNFRRFIDSQHTAENIILDLRGCPGGLLNESVDLASIFLYNGQLVNGINFTMARGNLIEEYKASSRNPPFRAKKLVIIVDEETASGAEVVAAALKHHLNAIIIGRPTYGFGEINLAIPIGNSYWATIKIGELTTPNGLSINGHSIQPDIVLDSTTNWIQTALELVSKK